jgi:hypothetical protein
MIMNNDRPVSWLGILKCVCQFLMLFFVAVVMDSLGEDWRRRKEMAAGDLKR